MTETTQRILTGAAMVIIAAAAAMAEHFGFHAVRWLAVAVTAMMIVEFAMIKSKNETQKTKPAPKLFGSDSYFLFRISFFALLLLVAVSAYFVGNRPWIILLLLLTIASADIGAWFFGRLIGGDKMWERLSAGKTWAGQIAGIACGTFAAVMYGLLGTDSFMPQLLWIGVSVSLLSQYGDLMASAVKRKMGIKDFGTILPGHGGILDRFDGWLIVLPVVWLVML